MQHPHPVPVLRTRLVAELKEQLQRLEGGKRPADRMPISTTCRELDQLLPEGGLRRGTLVEWLAPGGGGAGSLAVAVAAEACRGSGTLVVIDAREQFYPPAAARAGIDLKQTILVRPQSQGDEMWAVDQTLRTGGVAAVLCWIDRLAARDFRRLQLAVETAAGLGLLVRPAAARDEPSWADARFFVTPLAGAAQSPGQSDLEDVGWVELAQTPAWASQTDGATIASHGRQSTGKANADPRGSRLAPPTLQDSSSSLPAVRRLRVELLRLRGAPAGQTVELEIDDETGAVRLAATLAVGTTARRAAGA
jgi:protein ImuA